MLAKLEGLDMSMGFIEGIQTLEKACFCFRDGKYICLCTGYQSKGVPCACLLACCKHEAGVSYLDTWGLENQTSPAPIFPVLSLSAHFSQQYIIRRESCLTKSASDQGEEWRFPIDQLDKDLVFQHKKACQARDLHLFGFDWARKLLVETGKLSILYTLPLGMPEQFKAARKDLPEVAPVTSTKIARVGNKLSTTFKEQGNDPGVIIIMERALKEIEDRSRQPKESDLIFNGRDTSKKGAKRHQDVFDKNKKKQ
jgi:hypothetical protein